MILNIYKHNHIKREGKEMKKVLLSLSIIAAFGTSQAAYVSFISDNKFNIASDDPSSETGQIVGGGEYVLSEPSNGGGETSPEPIACEGPELTKRDLQNLIMGGGDYSKACISGITDFSDLFMLRDVVYDITNWDVSHVTNFSGMFSGSSFNQDISGWDVSSGTDFSLMFTQTSSFNQDIGGWDVSNGTNFGGMFNSTSSFNQDISNWNVSNGIYFNDMFSNSTVFNQDISGWDVSNGTNFSAMFANSNAFDQDISGWNVSNGIYFIKMFKDAKAFNQNISLWDVSSSSSWYDFNLSSSLASENIPAKFR